jgi:hypothetical protein
MMPLATDFDKGFHVLQTPKPIVKRRSKKRAGLIRGMEVFYPPVAVSAGRYHNCQKNLVDSVAGQAILIN